MRKLAYFSAGFVAGIYLTQYYILPYERYFLYIRLALIWGLAALFAGAIWEKLYAPCRRIVALSMGIALAIGWNGIYIQRVQMPLEILADTPANTKTQVSMTLCDYPTATAYGAKVVAVLDGYPRGKILYYGDASLLERKPGQRVVDTVRLQSAAKIHDEDVTTFTAKDIFLLAYHVSGKEFPETVYLSGTKDSPRWWPLRLGNALQKRITLLFAPDSAGFLRAILLGDKSQIAEEQRIILSESGIYHILAVSGMHCGFLLAAMLLIFRKRYQAAAIPILIFYALLTGCSPSVVRACIMLSLYIIAPLFHRKGDALTALGAAALLILLRNPFTAGSMSFQLSFAAMLGLLWLSPHIQTVLSRELADRRRSREMKKLNQKNNVEYWDQDDEASQNLWQKFMSKLEIYFINNLSMTAGALIFTVPLLVYYTDILTLVSPLSNILCLWAASYIFLLGILSIGISFFVPSVARLLAWISGGLVKYILWVTGLTARIPGQVLSFVNPYLWYWLMGVYVILAVLFLRRERRIKICLGSAIILSGALIFTLWLGVRRFSADLNMITLDVGQGQSILLSSGGKFALIDCGTSNSWYDPGATAANWLRAMGCYKLEYLCLTHFDNDHISGLTGLLTRIPAEHLLIPETPETKENKNNQVICIAKHFDTETDIIQTFQEIPLGNAKIRIYPTSDMVSSTDSNENGLVFLAGAGNQELLITGDMNSRTESLLLSAYNFPDIEYYVVGHHGSRYSTSDILLDTLKPEIACISVGSNSYGHPTEEVLTRLANHDCRIYRTDQDGSIYLPIYADGSKNAEIISKTG